MLGLSRLVKIAACNFSQTVFDTDDLSAIRGGSLLLLEFPIIFIKQLEARGHSVEAVASGASETLFRTSATVDEIDRFAAEFAGQDSYRHFTFVHAVTAFADGDDFRAALDELARICNRQQYKRRTVVEPGDGSTVCALTGILSAEGGDPPVSASVSARRTVGLAAKQRFYDWILNEPLSTAVTFARSFADLKPVSDDEVTRVPPSLQGKMALLYLDGNGFREKREKNSSNSTEYRAFSKSVEDKRRTLLTRVVEWSAAPIRDKAPRVRLETLLWGGDEVLWVVPAFTAWEFMAQVQENLNDATIWGDLTHACGLLIAPTKAPIKDLRSLVESLGNAAKEGLGGRSSNGIQIGVVKGFDLPGLDANDLRGPFIDSDADAPHRAFQISGACWLEVDRAMRVITANLPRAALHDIHLSAAGAGLFSPARAADAHDLLAKGMERMRTVSGGRLDEEAVNWLKVGLPGASDVASHPLVPLHQILTLWELVPAGREGAK